MPRWLRALTLTLSFHPKRRGPKGIRSDAERERAAAQVKFFEAAVKKVQASKPTHRNADVVAKCQEMLREREAEIHDYDSLKRGELNLPVLNRLDEIAALIPRIRIARGISQTELARHLGISKQVVSRYEETGYQTVGLARLQEILDTLGAKARIELGHSQPK